MPKFFAETEALTGDSILLDGASAEHLKVLRVRVGETLTVNVGDTDYDCAVDTAGGSFYRLSVLGSRPAEGEPSVNVTVYAGLPKGDKTETILQKAVELGASRICFFLSSRCVSRPDAKSMRGKLERWEKIVEAAAMQSYRGKLPEVCWLPDYDAMLRDASQAALRAFLWEGAKETSQRSLMERQGSFQTAALVTGPEGGFSEGEAAEAEEAGLKAVTLGKRILRCETAPLCALSAVMYHTGNLE